MRTLGTRGTRQSQARTCRRMAYIFPRWESSLQACEGPVGCGVSCVLGQNGSRLQQQHQYHQALSAYDEHQS